MLLQCFLSGLQHRLVELLGELLGREAFPRLGPAVQAARSVFRVRRRTHAVQQAGGLFAQDYVTASFFFGVRQGKGCVLLSERLRDGSEVLGRWSGGRFGRRSGGRRWWTGGSGVD